MIELWEGVIYQGKDYSEFYEVSNTGKLRNTKTKIVQNYVRITQLAECHVEAVEVAGAKPVSDTIQLLTHASITQ